MEKTITAGIDIGGTAVKLGLFDGNKRLIEKWSISTDKSLSAEQLMNEIGRNISGKLKSLNIRGYMLRAAGVGVPGSVNDDGIVTYAPNIGWKMFDAAKALKDNLGIPVSVENDANTAALGELLFGSARGASSLIFITLGTGVGAGVVLNEKIIRGHNGCCGELGHLTVNVNEKVPCSCGRFGCLEQYASATGIASIAKKKMAQASDSSSMLFKYDNVTAKEVFDSVRMGDSLASMVAEEFGKMLGLALAQAACLFDPQVFVIGGGVSNAGYIILEYIRKYFVKYAYADSRKAEFAIASLGNDAGIYGGCALAWQITESK